jgi:hypothetical protein
MPSSSTDNQSYGDGNSSATGKTSAAAGFKDRTCRFELQLTPKAGWALVYLCLRRDPLLQTFNIANISPIRILSDLSRTFTKMGSPRTAIPVVFGSMTIGKPGKFTFIADFNIKYGTKYIGH